MKESVDTEVLTENQIYMIYFKKKWSCSNKLNFTAPKKATNKMVVNPKTMFAIEQTKSIQHFIFRCFKHLKVLKNL